MVFFLPLRCSLGMATVASASSIYFLPVDGKGFCRRVHPHRRHHGRTLVCRNEERHTQKKWICAKGAQEMKKFIYIVSAVLLLASSFGANAGGCKYRDLNDCNVKAEQGDVSAQTMLGVMYATGKGVPKDYVRAYMFFTIRAANRSDVGGDVGADSRDFIAKGMTSSQIEKAQGLAREWMQKHR